MSDLAAFGEAVGFTVEQQKDRLIFQVGEEKVEFDASHENGTVTVIQTDEEAKYQYRLKYERRLARWVLVITRQSGSTEQLILFDTGLEFLMDEVFELEAEVEPEEVEEPVEKTPPEPEETHDDGRSRKRSL
jgi:hypothetical protein